MKLDFEELFCKAFNELIEQNGGSLETALNDMGVNDEEQRNAIIEWYGPECYEYGDEEENDEEGEIKHLKYLLNKESCCSLDKDEMYELQELLNKYGYPSY